MDRSHRYAYVYTHNILSLSHYLSACRLSSIVSVMLAVCLPSSLSTYLPGSLPVGGLNHMMLGCRDDARFPAQTADKHVRAHGFTEVLFLLTLITEVLF